MSLNRMTHPHTRTHTDCMSLVALSVYLYARAHSTGNYFNCSWSNENKPTIAIITWRDAASRCTVVLTLVELRLRQCNTTKHVATDVAVC